MKPNDLETLSALMDGESVDVEILRGVLQRPDATEALLDFARVRNAFLADATRPSASAAARWRAGLHSGSGWRWVGAAALVALLVLAGTSGWWLGPSAPGSEARAELTVPEPDRVERFVPGVDWR